MNVIIKSHSKANCLLKPRKANGLVGSRGGVRVAPC